MMIIFELLLLLLMSRIKSSEKSRKTAQITNYIVFNGLTYWRLGSQRLFDENPLLQQEFIGKNFENCYINFKWKFQNAIKP